jgi:putative Mg2+ transporter-C (MgtC) family protein
VVTGIGFLGAGVILFTEGKLKGLTTASSIWVAAALGMAVGGGDYPLALAATIVVIVVLTSFSMLDRLLDRFSREIRSYEISFAGGEGKRLELEGLFREKNLRIRNRRPMKMDGRSMITWDLDGQLRFHQSLVENLMADGDILLLKY